MDDRISDGRGNVLHQFIVNELANRLENKKSFAKSIDKSSCFSSFEIWLFPKALRYGWGVNSGNAATCYII